jgi:hypothetical protein
MRVGWRRFAGRWRKRATGTCSGGGEVGAISRPMVQHSEPVPRLRVAVVWTKPADC